VNSAVNKGKWIINIGESALFHPIEFEGFRNQAGLNSFVLTPKQWVEKTKAIGIFSKAGRYGGTFAHKDIAF
jgi:hypothetical protein